MTTLNLAGWRVRLVLGPDHLAAAAACRYAPFLSDDVAPLDLTIEMTASSMMPSSMTPSSTEDGTGSRFTDLLEAPLVAQGEGYSLDARTVRGWINLSSRQASLVTTNPAPLIDLEGFLRMACALLAYREGGLLVHGAALVVNGNAHLFIGQSGSGKSTVVALSPGATALGDDLVLLRPDRQGWLVYGTPFWNAHSVARQGQISCGVLTGVYKLVKDPRVYLETMSPAAATAELAASCPVVNGDPSSLPGLMTRCRQLAADVPVRRLHFRKDAAFWSLLLDQES
jgi:hypothetical protein